MFACKLSLKLHLTNVVRSNQITDIILTFSHNLNANLIPYKDYRRYKRHIFAANTFATTVRNGQLTFRNKLSTNQIPM